MAGQVRGFETLYLRYSGCQLDLLDNSVCGISLVEGGTGRTWGGTNDDVVFETLNLKVAASSVTVQALRFFVDRARETKDGISQANVYLEGRSPHAANTMRSVVLDGKLDEARPLYNFAGARAGLERYELALERKTAWELMTGVDTIATSIRTISATSPIATVSTYNTGASSHRTIGDMPARIVDFEFSNLGLTGSASTIKEFWAGFRTKRDTPNPEAQVCAWDMGTSATRYGTDTTDGSSASATSACAAIWTPNDDTETALLERIAISASSAVGTTNAGRATGRYTVLLRARATGTRTFSVRAGRGNVHTGATLPKMGNVLVSGNFFKLYQIGPITLPTQLGQTTNAIAPVRQEGVDISAGVSGSGSGNLELDMLYFIPIGEGHIYARTACAAMLGSAAQLNIFHRDNGHKDTRLTQGTLSSGPASFEGDLLLPLGLQALQEGSVVVCYQDTDRHRLADEIEVTIEYTARYSRTGA